MERPIKDDFKWFGEGFDGFPKRLPEDCVEYTIYVLDEALDEAQVLARLEEIKAVADQLTKNLLKEYIWQRGHFALEISKDGAVKSLSGRTDYGDSVEDEWLIVHIVLELSKLCPDIWVEIIDTDGQFLLIEAANALPRWLNPEIADHRVWLHEGNLLIIPLSQKQAQSGTRTAPISKSLTLQEAHDFIRTSSASLIHSPLIEAEAFYRLRNYPVRISENLHHSLITIPRRLAFILHERPDLISAAVEAFYLRDPIVLRQLQSRDKSHKLYFPPEDFVTVSVKFTKVGFAQVKSQQFDPPPAWVGYSSAKPGTKAFDSAEVGMKVSCGFEMLASDPQNNQKEPVTYIQDMLSVVDDGGEKLPTDEEIATWERKHDDESWLDINFEDFDKELSGQTVNSSKGKGNGFGDETAQEDLRKMVKRFEEFLNDEEAGVEGAEGLDDMDFDDDDGDEDDDIDDSDSSEAEDKEVSFDEAEFGRMMREMMGLPPAPHDNQSPLSNLRKVKKQVQRIEELDSEDEDEGDEGEGEKLRKTMKEMEIELKEAGALDLDPTARGKTAIREPGNSENLLMATDVQKRDQLFSDSDDESENEDGEIDFTLARNLMESFKAQAGAQGPAGNMLSILGMKLPRDELDDDDAGMGSSKADSQGMATK